MYIIFNPSKLNLFKICKINGLKTSKTEKYTFLVVFFTENGFMVVFSLRILSALFTSEDFLKKTQVSLGDLVGDTFPISVRTGFFT